MNKIPQHPDDASFEASYRTGYLISAYIHQKLTPAEREELDNWIETAPENLALFEDLIDEKNTKQSLNWFKRLDTERAKRRLHQKLALPPERNLFQRWLPYAVAACVLLLAVVGAWYYKAKPSDAQRVAQNGTDAIQPGGNKATLTLADGRTIVLDSAASGNLTVESTVTITKEDDILTYVPEGSANIAAPVYNTLTVPKGGQYRIRLADGTKVWLNSASSLRFPANFTGAERRVTLQGECYFEVAKNNAMPFHVDASGTDIAVLGTHFNIRAYPDEPSLKTTLVEGSVQVSQAAQAIQLRPGEQAQVYSTGGATIQVDKNADLEKVTGWKQGLFVFRNDSLPAVMNELERWYNITVDNATGSTDHFTGTFERSVPLAKILNYLEGTGQVHFRIEGKKVSIQPAANR